MAMYVLNQIAVKIEKSQEAKKALEQLADHFVISNIPNDFNDEIQSIDIEQIMNELDVDRNAMSPEQIDAIDSGLFRDEVYAPQDTPESALNPFIQENDDNYLMYIPYTKPGYSLDEGKPYHQNHFDDVKLMASAISVILPNAAIAYDSKSEQEQYVKRSFIKLEK